MELWQALIIDTVILKILSHKPKYLFFIVPPALQPVVNDLFISRSLNKADSGKDLDTQREVIVSMLLRLLNNYEALELLSIVLQASRRETEEKWKRLSRQVVDAILPLLQNNQISIRNQMQLDVLHRLFEAVAPSVLRPTDILLRYLFVKQGSLVKRNAL